MEWPVYESARCSVYIHAVVNIITNGRGAISCHGNSKACTHVPFNNFRGVPERGACHAIQLMAQCLWTAAPNMNTSIQVFCFASQYYVHVPCGHVNCAIQCVCMLYTDTYTYKQMYAQWVAEPGCLLPARYQFIN